MKPCFGLIPESAVHFKAVFPPQLISLPPTFLFFARDKMFPWQGSGVVYLKTNPVDVPRLNSNLNYSSQSEQHRLLDYTAFQLRIKHLW